MKTVEEIKKEEIEKIISETFDGSGIFLDFEEEKFEGFDRLCEKLAENGIADEEIEQVDYVEYLNEVKRAFSEDSRFVRLQDGGDIAYVTKEVSDRNRGKLAFIMQNELELYDSGRRVCYFIDDWLDLNYGIVSEEMPPAYFSIKEAREDIDRLKSEYDDALDNEKFNGIYYKCDYDSSEAVKQNLTLDEAMKLARDGYEGCEVLVSEKVASNIIGRAAESKKSINSRK